MLMFSRGLLTACGGIIFSILAVGVSAALEPPSQDLLKHLGSEDFKERASAQGALLEWARKQPETAKDWLFRRALSDADPEARRRYTAVLRDLVVDDYLKDGEGYVGIMMTAVQLQVPNDPVQRTGVSVTLVVPDTAGAKAGLVPGDVIVEAGDQVWRDLMAVENFSTWIRSHKPGQKVTVKVFRNGNLVPMDLVLGRRPPESGMFMFGQLPDSASLANEAELAKDAYFRNWFEARKAGK